MTKASNSNSLQIADLGIGGITITAARSAAADFSIPYMQELFGLLSQIPFPLPKWKAIFWPFQIEVWSGILLSILIFGPVFYGFLSAIDDASNMDFTSCMFESAKTLCMQCKLM